MNTGAAWKVRTPYYFSYVRMPFLMRALEGVKPEDVRALAAELAEQRGTPQDPVDWTDPDTWIAERLSGPSAELAQRIWQLSKGTFNPRYLSGDYIFLREFELMAVDKAGLYRLTTRGQRFLAGEKALLRELDDAEGFFFVLGLLSAKGKVRRGELLPEWREFLQKHSRFASESTIKMTLHTRLRALGERGLVKRDGLSYELTPAGAAYVQQAPEEERDPKREVLRAAAAFNEAQRGLLRARLGEMHPYRFEHLVRELLEAMGYEDVQVTKESGDKGVDVIATVQFGITTITEVIQVKRHQGSIGRPILDQLRGALPYHKALQGKIITLGTFSKGCTEAALFPGAAPIGLIDGERLLDLLFQHRIGVKRKEVELFELDDEPLSQPVDELVVDGEVA